MPAGTIVTFYSWKGGVGRTMALANIAVQLSRRGHSVLMVDWDLEAPGLDRYFLSDDARKNAKVQASEPADRSGLMGLLDEAFHRKNAELDESSWRDKLVTLSIPRSEPTTGEPTPPLPNRLELLPSGHGSDDYAAKLAAFSWSDFFATGRGGEWLEELRDQWAAAYEFVLIDSRTGLTDSGGVCTVQMPHMLVLVFTANNQSLEGGLRIVAAAQEQRSSFGYDRPPLSILPLLSRWEGESEVDIAEEWMRRFDMDLRPLTGSWLPREFSPRQFLEKTRVPHVPRFSFGEPLPVLTHSLTDPGLPGTYFDALAQLIRANLRTAAVLLDPNYLASPRVENEGEILALVLDQTKLHQEIGRLANIHGAEAPQLRQFLDAAGTALRRLARFGEAEPLMRRALAINEKSFGPDHSEVATALNNLALLLRDTNRLGEAEPLMRRTLAIDEKSFGPNHPEVATALSNLALLLRDTNRLDEAEPLVRRSLSIDEKSFGPDHPKVAIRLNNLAQLLQATNRLGEAEPLMRRALAIDERSFGPDHPGVTTALNNLALLLQATNRLGEAEPLMRRALAIDEKSFGPDHPKVAIRLNNLAQLLQATKRLGEAEPLMHRALAIDEKSFGPDHPKVAIRLNNLAQLLQDTNRLGEAEPLMHRALAIDEKSFGPDHPEVATDLGNLAQLLQATNRLGEAEPLIRQALDILAAFERTTGHRHPSYQTNFQNYAALLRAMGKSESEIQEALRMVSSFRT
jgi:tetratricopeptide (TPR) repeat protein